MDARTRYASTIAIFAVVLFLALAIAASGIISLYTDREVLTEPDANGRAYCVKSKVICFVR